MTDAHPLPAKVIRIGRQLDNDIALTGHLEVSRHHAELRRNPDGGFEIIDLGSHSGTYVNGERITPKLLTEQDVISIGHAAFRLSGGELRQCTDESPGSLHATTNAHEVVAAYWAAAEPRSCTVRPRHLSEGGRKPRHALAGPGHVPSGGAVKG
jgi:hypothetical protein